MGQEEKTKIYGRVGDIILIIIYCQRIALASHEKITLVNMIAHKILFIHINTQMGLEVHSTNILPGIEKKKKNICQF